MTHRSNLCVVGTLRWREHFAKSRITFHAGYRSPVLVLNVAFTSAQAHDWAHVMLEHTEIVPALTTHTSCKLATTLASVAQSVTRGGVVRVHVIKANLLSRMFVVMACNFHPAWPSFWAAAFWTET